MEPLPSTPDPAQLAAHAPWIRSLALRLVRDAARADDLVQETLLAALEQRPTTDRPLRPWLRSVLARRFAFGLRSEARRRERERESASREELPSSRDLAEEAELHARLVQALARLREPYRTALLLRYYEGLAPKEIARRLELPGATVRSHLKRGLDELRAQLASEREQGGEHGAWCVALLPLALGAPEVGAFTNPLVEVLDSIRAMHPIIHVTVASGVLLLTGTFVARGLDGDGTDSLSPAAHIPPLIERDAGSVSEGSETRTATSSRRTPVFTAAGASERGGSAAAPATTDEVVVGFVRDSDTDAPVPGYQVGVRLEGDEADWEWLWTDEAGRFEGTVPYASGVELDLILRDHQTLTVARTQRQVMPTSFSLGLGPTWDPAQAPLQFKATVGPTFRLALSAPFEVEAALLVATLEPSEHAPWGNLSTSYQFRAPVRAGDPHWTRFAKIESYHIPQERPWLLRVETLDGLWAGEAEVATVEGVHPETVAMQLTQAARLEVEVVTVTEYADLVVFADALETGAHRILTPKDSAELTGGRHAYRFELMAQPAGAYQVSVSSEGVEQIAAGVSLALGQVHEERIELAASPALSHIRGELRSLSGEYKDKMMLHLTGPTTATYTMRRPQWVERDGVWVAPFTFDNLPLDSYDLQLSSFMDRYRWDRSVDLLSPPLDDLVLTCRDTDPMHDVEIHVKDAVTGATITLGGGGLTAAGCASASTALGTAGRSIFQKVPIDAVLEWWARAEGYVPLFGDESAMVEADGKGVITADLQPGWGARIEVTDASTREPLAGVSVLLDGVLAGATDDGGRLDLSAGSAPAHVDLELDGWQFSAGGYDPEARVLKGYGPIYPISLSDLP